MVERGDWVGRAACAGTNPEMWFPVTWNQANIQIPRFICRGCPVRKICLEFALATYTDDGMFGGLTGEERKRLRRARGIPVPRMVRDLMPHGTPAAVKRHEREHSKLCDRCQIVKNERNLIRKRARAARRRSERVSA